MTAATTKTVVRFERAEMLRELQRALVPHLALDEVDSLLVRVEAAGALESHDDGFEPVSTLCACLYDHPAFYDARERGLPTEEAFFEGLDEHPPRPEGVRYRIEERVTVLDEVLADDNLLFLSLPVPRDIPGVQRTLLVEADPPGLRKHFLPSAGLVYAAPFAIEPGVRVAPFRMVFEVERSAGARGDIALARVQTPDEDSQLAAEWALRVTPARRSMPAQDVVDHLVERMEEEFAFAPLVAPVQRPVHVLLTANAGDVSMQGRLLVGALQALGIAARCGHGQRLALEAGRSRFWYPRGLGYDDVFVEWRDIESGEAGVVDLSYLARWGNVATEENSTEVFRQRVEKVGARARKWMQRNLYPLDFILAGTAPPSLLKDPSSGESVPLLSPVDVALQSERIP